MKKKSVFFCSYIIINVDINKQSNSFHLGILPNTVNKR